MKTNALVYFNILTVWQGQSSQYVKDSAPKIGNVIWCRTSYGYFKVIFNGFIKKLILKFKSLNLESC